MIFINNKYTRWYFRIIETARNSSFIGYTERHHIVPKSLGGSNTKDNVVRLSARQHFVCHLLLIKMTSVSDQVKMIYAARHMSICHRKEHYRVTSITYERLKRQASESMRGNTRGASNKGKKRTLEQRKRMMGGSGNTKPRSAETRRKSSLAKMGNKYGLGHKRTSEQKLKASLKLTGQKRTLEQRKNISVALMGKTKDIPKHCGLCHDVGHNRFGCPKRSTSDKQSDKQKRTLQFTYEGLFLAEYPSVKVASQLTSISYSNITGCCAGKRNRAGGYVWRYASTASVTNSESSKHAIPCEIDDSKVDFHISMVDEMRSLKLAEPSKS